MRALAQVDEFVVGPMSGHITHIVLREGHLWGQRDVCIPMSHVERIKEDGVYLNIDKKMIESMPAVPVRRRW